MTQPTHYLVPANISGGATSEVFEVVRVVTQPARPGVEAWTTVHLVGVNTGRKIALGLPDLANLAEPVTTRQDGGNE
jgi:hypothetical protein